MDAADNNTRKPLQLAKNNQIIINELRQENETMKEKIKSNIIEEAEESK